MASAAEPAAKRQRGEEGGRYVKKAANNAFTGEDETRALVQKMLEKIRDGREAAVAEYCKTLDKFDKEILVSKEAWDAGIATLTEQEKKDVDYAHGKVKLFAEKQRESIKEFETELSPGVFAGQKVSPMQTAGCYVPGGRYAHIASCIMTVTTARVAGVSTVVVASPPRGGACDPIILYAARLCGADHVLCCGGVQAIAALRFGLFTGAPADILAGPGNKFVAEAKRMLYGEVAIDMFAGPTEIAILADDSADPEMVATDLVSQAEHGLNSPVWLITTSERVATAVNERVPVLAAMLPADARQVAEVAWRDFGEIFLADSREAAARKSDEYAAEHLEVHCDDLPWWLKTLKNYGSLFLGEETCVTYGDKCSGPNHVLPTKGAGKYTGGLSVHKFLKICTYQRMSREANRELAVVAARISRAEGMEGHARAGDARIAKYFPAERRALLEAASTSPEASHVAAWPATTTA